MSDAYSLLTNCVPFPPAPQHSAPRFFIKNNIVGIKKNSNKLIFAGHCCLLYRYRILTDIYSLCSTESSPLTPACIFNCSFLDQMLHRYFLSFLASTWVLQLFESPQIWKLLKMPTDAFTVPESYLNLYFCPQKTWLSKLISKWFKYFTWVVFLSLSFWLV